LVVHDAVAVREGATLNVLARDAHVVALKEESSPRKLLGERPIDALAAADHLGACLVVLADHAVRRERLGQLGDRLAHLRWDERGWGRMK
jgi:hypothetical protein